MCKTPPAVCNFPTLEEAAIGAICALKGQKDIPNSAGIMGKVDKQSISFGHSIW